MSEGFQFKKLGDVTKIENDAVAATQNRSTGKWGLWNSTRQRWVSKFFDTQEQAEAQHCPEAFSGTHTWIGSRCINCDYEAVPHV